ncbi:MAG: PrsW family intramembrane metalloprotease [Propionibacteriaceae bacterium]
MTVSATAGPGPIPSIPVRPRGLDTRSLVFWVSLAAVLVGTLSILAETVYGLVEAPVVAAVALLFSLVYGLVAVLFLASRQLFERRRTSAIVAALIWGGLGAIGVAGIANGAGDTILIKTAGPLVAETWGPAITAPITEETLKLLGVAVIALIAHNAVRSTLDGLFFGVLVGLGFQVIEDFSYALTAGAAGGLDDMVTTFLFRSVLGGLFSHAVYTGITGAGLGYLIARKDKSWAQRIGAAVGLFLLAMGIHFLWNSPLLNNTIGFFIKSVPALVILLLLLRWARQRDRVEFERVAATSVDPRLLPPDEARELETRKSRKLAQKKTVRAVGPAAKAPVRALQAAQLDLVNAITDEGGGSASAQLAVLDIERARQQLSSLAARGPASRP